MANHVWPEKMPMIITAIINKKERMTSAMDKLYSNFITKNSVLDVQWQQKCAQVHDFKDDRRHWIE